jgi:hypothetical protein
VKHEDARHRKTSETCLEINPALKGELEKRIELAEVVAVYEALKTATNQR